MGLLDGDIQELFGEVFGEGVYLDATLHRTTLAAGTDGDLTPTTVDAPCKAHFDVVTEAMREEAGFDDTDVAIIILQYQVSPAVTTDDEITLGGKRWKISAPVKSDPAATHWIVRGQAA